MFITACTINTEAVTIGLSLCLYQSMQDVLARCLPRNARNPFWTIMDPEGYFRRWRHFLFSLLIDRLKK